MKKWIFLGLLSLNVVYSAAPAPDKDQSGSWETRLDSIIGAIDRSFDEVSSTFSNWTVNSAQIDTMFQFRMQGMDQRELLKKIIQEGSKKGQKKFYALDLGSSSDFAWGREIKDYINDQKDLPEDIQVAIIGVHGDWTETKFFKEGKCIVYQIDSFKLENLKKALKPVGLDLENTVDLIVSHYTFTHLVDPLGTWMQAYDLLRPQTGVFLYDGFRIYLKETLQEKETWDYLAQLNAFLLYELNIPFLISTEGSRQYYGHFLVKKVSTDALDIPFKYVEVKEEKDALDRFSDKTNFRSVYTLKDKGKEKKFLKKMNYKSLDLWNPVYIGKKDIFDWLQESKLIPDYVKWEPLLKE